MTRTELTRADEGKDVVGPDGQVLGRITRVEDGRATVEPDPVGDDDVLAALGWGDPAGGPVVLEADRVIERTDDEVVLSEW